jgi:hypothetical protein
MGITCGVRVAPATMRQQFRFPEEASTATISGCKSSVREITGNKSARAQTIATVSRKTRARGFRRDTNQRKRQSQRAASVTINQSKLRIVSIIPARSRIPSGAAWQRQPLGREPHSTDAKFTTMDAAMQFVPRRCVQSIRTSFRGGAMPPLAPHRVRKTSHRRRACPRTTALVC